VVALSAAAAIGIVWGTHEYESIERVRHFMPLSLNIFVLFLGLETKNIIASKAFYKWGGNISYALYLVHILVIAAAGRLYLALGLDAHVPFPVLAIAIGAGSLIGASILYYLYEAPLLRFLRKASHVQK